jgi:nucleoside-diphosphate-sugar epimerase
MAEWQDKPRTELAGVRVAVTGAAGMVGSAICRHLDACGAAVVAHAGPAGTDVGAIPQHVPAALFDIADTDRLADLAAKVDAIVHAAGPPSVAESFRSPARYAHAHVTGTASVLEACRSARVARLVQISSAEVYGHPAHNPVDELAPTVPRSPYGAVKLASEQLVRTWCGPEGIAAVVLRPFSVYGPASPPGSLVGRLLRVALGEDDPVRLASLRPVRDYVHVDDVARACSAAISALAAGAAVDGGVYNVASGVGTSVRQLAELMLRAAGRAAAVEQQAEGDRPPGTDVTELVADISRARTGLGWQPSIPLADGLADALRRLPGPAR